MNTKYYFDKIDKTKEVPITCTIDIFKYTDKKLPYSDSNIRYIVNFFMANLVSKQMLKNLQINLFINPKLDVIGNVEECDDHPSRRFILNMRAIMQRKKFVKCIAHECVHIRQMAYGHLNPNLKGKHLLWKKEPFDVTRGGYDGYWFYPWEIEAFGLEEGLYSLLQDHFYLIGKNDT